MPRKKKVEVEKTSLEIALEQAEAPEPAPPKPSRKGKKKPSPSELVKGKDFVRYTPPKLTLKRKGVNYKEGDVVEVVHANETTVGVLKAILSSQIVVRTEDDRELFFFQSGLKIRKLSA